MDSLSVDERADYGHEGEDIESTDSAPTGAAGEYDGDPMASLTAGHTTPSKPAMSSALQEQDASQAADSIMLEKHSTPSFDPLKRRRRVLWILAFYIPLLLIPWVVTCVQNYRPISIPSYIGHGGEYTPADYRLNAEWQTAVRVMNSILAILTLPVTSALLAQAAVIHAHRKRSSKALSLPQLLDLADRGWSDVNIMFKEMQRTSSDRQGRRNWFLRLGASFAVLCMLLSSIIKAQY